MSEPENEDPAELFQDAMRGVRPLNGPKVHHQQRKPNADVPDSTLKTRRSAAEQVTQNSSAALSDAWVDPVEPEQVLDYHKPGIQPTQLRRLRQGSLPIQYQLDLHGYKIDEARDTTAEFLRFCRSQGFTCVRIIHGKAHRNRDRQTTLKSHINHWLKQLPETLAFCSAPPGEGGTGSVLVLLKKNVELTTHIKRA